MRSKLIIILWTLFAGAAVAQTQAEASYQQRFAALAQECIHQEYPNHILHHVSGPGEMDEPRVLHPAFYGCFDWHSSVHGHWLASFATYLTTRRGM